jgi:hypothetical protein
MKSFALTSRLRWGLPVLTVLLFASCGGNDNNTPNQVVTASNSAPAMNAFSATLSGAQETPANASSASATGTLVIDPVSKMTDARIVTSRIVGTMAHIHLGAVGVAGAIIFPMTETAPGSGVWTTHTSVTDAQITLFKAGNYYFNVHSAAFPLGEIRGQITLTAGATPVSLPAPASTSAAAMTPAATGPAASIPAASIPAASVPIVPATGSVIMY